MKVINTVIIINNKIIYIFKHLRHIKVKRRIIVRLTKQAAIYKTALFYLFSSISQTVSSFCNQIFSIAVL